MPVFVLALGEFFSFFFFFIIFLIQIHVLLYIKIDIHNICDREKHGRQWQQKTMRNSPSNMSSVVWALSVCVCVYVFFSHVFNANYCLFNLYRYYPLHTPRCYIQPPTSHYNLLVGVLSPTTPAASTYNHQHVMVTCWWVFLLCYSTTTYDHQQVVATCWWKFYFFDMFFMCL